MTERPMIFTDHSVRMILDGHKTQTRRVVTWSNSTSGGAINPKLHEVDWSRARADNDHLHVPFALPEWATDPADDTCGRVFSRVQPGAHLWVKETWAPAIQGGDCLYRADTYVGPFAFTGPWHSPMFMPRWASRLTLEVVDVRPERLCEISAEDVRAEGVMIDAAETLLDHRRAFADVWNSINGKQKPGQPDARFEANPWVWALTFRVVG